MQCAYKYAVFKLLQKSLIIQQTYTGVPSASHSSQCPQPPQKNFHLRGMCTDSFTDLHLFEMSPLSE
jgi:hypothetical protein